MTEADATVHSRTGGSGLYDLVTTSRRPLLIVFVVCAVAGYLLSGFMRRAYRADAVIVPVQSSSQGLMSGLSGLLGSSALSGLGMAPAADKNESKETLQSRTLIRQFINERKLMPQLCASKAIKCETGAAPAALAAEHQMDDAIKLFRDDLLSVDEDTITGVIHVSLIWYDRVLAAQWCNGLIELTNRLMQSKARELAVRRIGFLQDEYKRADTINLQASISTLLQTELSKSTDANTRPEFALRVVDPASAPDDRHPTRPRKAVIGTASGILGALLALAVLGVRKRRAR
jgi:uncharacterized protein involved in exopolysaccharide biosynthesis